MVARIVGVLARAVFVAPRRAGRARFAPQSLGERLGVDRAGGPRRLRPLGVRVDRRQRLNRRRGVGQPEYDATTDPNHAAAGFPTACAQCHDTTVWSAGQFTHPATFPLTGGHAAPACADCHAGSVFAGTPTDCASCHLDDYNATTNPNHANSGFPTDCAQCHNATVWTDATFNHSFPINSGAHSNLDCIDCHVVPSATPAFECILCHTHSESRMGDTHSGVNNYQWVSTACLNCHPNGRG